MIASRAFPAAPKPVRMTEVMVVSVDNHETYEGSLNAHGGLSEELVSNHGGLTPNRIEVSRIEQNGSEACVSDHAVSVRFKPTSLEASVLAAFSKLTPTTSDPAGNLDAIPELVRLASSLGPPEEILPRMIDAYHGLVSGSLNGISQRDREFWSKQPCTPKAMRQLWDRLVGQVRGKIQAGKAEEEAASNPFVTGDFSGFDDEKEAKDDDDF